LALAGRGASEQAFRREAKERDQSLQFIYLQRPLKITP
jgi:hypothetical protein